MSYKKTTWKDRLVEFPHRYLDQHGNSLVLTPDEGNITEEGTFINATSMNKIEDELALLDTEKVDKIEGMGLTQVNYTQEEHDKLLNIEKGANKYIHPSAHNATMITTDATHRFVTDVEKSKWSNKADTTIASTSANGLMSSSDKIKLNGIASNANNYTHPSTHSATMITTDSTHRFVTDTEKSNWNNKSKVTIDKIFTGISSKATNINQWVSISVSKNPLDYDLIFVTIGQGKDESTVITFIKTQTQHNYAVYLYDTYSVFGFCQLATNTVRFEVTQIKGWNVSQIYISDVTGIKF